MSHDEPGNEKVAPLGVESTQVFFVGVCILLALVACLAAMVGFYSWKIPARDFLSPKTFPGPSVFQAQAGERDRLFAEQRRRLDGAAVPISEAMSMIARRGQAAFLPLPVQQSAPTVAAQESKAVAGPARHMKSERQTHRRGKRRTR